MQQQSSSSETIDFIYNATLGGPESQFRDADGLDAKLVQLFAAASVVIGLAGVSNASRGGWLVTAMLVAALTVYVAIAGASIFGLWIRHYRKAYHADTMWKCYWDMTPVDIKHVLVEEVAEVYNHNKMQLKKKAYSARVAMIGTSIEVLLIGWVVLAGRLA